MKKTVLLLPLMLLLLVLLPGCFSAEAKEPMPAWPERLTGEYDGALSFTFRGEAPAYAGVDSQGGRMTALFPTDGGFLVLNWRRLTSSETELMEDFIESNPGLRSRFNRYLEFEDYTPDEMVEIFCFNCKKSCYEPEEDALELLKDYFAKMSDDDKADFGNARGVRNVFERTLSCQADRLAEKDEVSRDDLMLLTKADAAAAIDADNIENDTENS